MRRVVPFVLMMALAAAVPASAQDPEKAVTFNVGGGYTFAMSEVKDHLGNGYNINVGLGIRLTDTMRLSTEYSFNGLGEKRITIPPGTVPPGQTAVTDVYGSMNMHYGSFSLVFAPNTAGRAKPYFMFGPGVYYRPVKVTTPSVGYIPPYCDPWWYWCYPGGLVPVDRILAERASTDLGINVGGGVNIAVGDSASFYIEARYHYIWGPELKNAAGQSQGKATGQFFPITFGMRF